MRRIEHVRVAPAEQVHIDLGALAQRVTGTENAIANLSNQFTNLSDSFSSQMRDLGSKIDAQQKSFSESRSTNWTGFTQASAAIVGVVLMLVGSVIWPQVTGLSKLVDVVARIQEDKIGLREHDEFKLRINSAIVGETSDRKEADARLDKFLSVLDSQLVKRPEIESSNKSIAERLEVLSVHYDALQKQVYDLLSASLLSAHAVTKP